MSLLHTHLSEPETLTRLAGITGIGWTVSLIAFLSSVAISPNSPVTALLEEPRTLLYLGLVLFVVTVGLDRLTAAVTPE